MNQALFNMNLLTFLQDRSLQLRSRYWQIENYLKNPETPLGKTDYTEADLAKIKKDFQETNEAIEAVKSFRKAKPQPAFDSVQFARDHAGQPENK